VLSGSFSEGFPREEVRMFQEMIPCWGKAHSLPRVSFEKRQHSLLYFENGVFVLYSHTLHIVVASNY